MKKYKQLTSGQRYQIYGLKQAGLMAWDNNPILETLRRAMSKLSRSEHLVLR